MDSQLPRRIPRVDMPGPWDDIAYGFGRVGVWFEKTFASVWAAMLFAALVGLSSLEAYNVYRGFELFLPGFVLAGWTGVFCYGAFLTISHYALLLRKEPLGRGLAVFAVVFGIACVIAVFARFAAAQSQQIDAVQIRAEERAAVQARVARLEADIGAIKRPIGIDAAAIEIAAAKQHQTELENDTIRRGYVVDGQPVCQDLMARATRADCEADLEVLRKLRSEIAQTESWRAMAIDEDAKYRETAAALDSARTELQSLPPISGAEHLGAATRLLGDRNVTQQDLAAYLSALLSMIFLIGTAYGMHFFLVYRHRVAGVKPSD